MSKMKVFEYFPAFTLLLYRALLFCYTRDPRPLPPVRGKMIYNDSGKEIKEKESIFILLRLFSEATGLLPV